MKMAERAYELVCAIINICHDKEAALAPAMVRSITQFSEYVGSPRLGRPPAHPFLQDSREDFGLRAESGEGGASAEDVPLHGGSDPHHGV
jgi:hypothetical protein